MPATPLLAAGTTSRSPSEASDAWGQWDGNSDRPNPVPSPASPHDEAGVGVVRSTTPFIRVIGAPLPLSAAVPQPVTTQRPQSIPLDLEPDDWVEADFGGAPDHSDEETTAEPVQAPVVDPAVTAPQTPPVSAAPQTPRPLILAHFFADTHESAGNYYLPVNKRQIQALVSQIQRPESVFCSLAGSSSLQTRLCLQRSVLRPRGAVFEALPRQEVSQGQ